MEEFEYLCEYLEEYKSSTSKKIKNQIKNKFLKLVFEEEGFSFERNKKIIFGNLYEKKFNISHEQKLLFAKWCIYKMFENFLTEEEYEIESIKRNLKKSYEISDKYLYDTPSFDNRIEDYFARTVYFELKNKAWKFHNSSYFQCQECGGLFIKIKNIKNTSQKYCLDCKSIVEKRKTKERIRRFRNGSKINKTL